MSSLADREKVALLEVARRALAAAVLRQNPVEDFECDPALRRAAGAFVTITLRGRLRGCIGQLESGDSLAKVVAHCARSAASNDPRFQPVRPDELPSIEIEVSVLSALEDIRPEAVEVGRHGLIVSNGTNRGLLLPQVATEFRWDAGRFLEETCEKAGLPRDAWKSSETRLQAFTAESFKEKDLPTRR